MRLLMMDTGTCLHRLRIGVVLGDALTLSADQSKMLRDFDVIVRINGMSSRCDIEPTLVQCSKE